MTKKKVLGILNTFSKEDLDIYFDKKKILCYYGEKKKKKKVEIVCLELHKKFFLLHI